MPSPARIHLAEFFASFRRRLASEAANDPEPGRRFTPQWFAWQRRHWNHDLRRIELAEVEALTTDPTDPAPLASEGLAEFLDWVRRQDARRAKRKKRIA
jgi:hypothetical protein